MGSTRVLLLLALIGLCFADHGNQKLGQRLAFQHYTQVINTLSSVEMSVENSKLMETLTQRGGRKSSKLDQRLIDLADLLGRVAAIERQIKRYTQVQEQLEWSTLYDYAKWSVSHDPNALTGLLERIHDLIVPPYKFLLGQGLFELALDFLQDEDSDVCELQMSPHQLIHDMYNTIALTEIKGYAMMQFSWMLLRIYGKGNYTQEASLTRQRYNERTGQTAAAAKAALSMAKRDLYRCDPQHYTSSTYAEVTRLLQGYIENEVDLNSDGTCKQNCAYYNLAENHGCFKEQFCARQPKCSGRIFDCQYVDSDMWVCPAGRSTSRRYEWIEYENGRTLGKQGSCRLGTTKVDSWWRWLFWHCSYCMCLCDDTTNSDRYFSLREANSDISDNKVVTGVKFLKRGQVFHLQVTQGKLLDQGFVESGEDVPVTSFDPNSYSVTEGEDYHTLTYEKRIMDLDELHCPPGQVLTGVRFRMLGSHLHFEIRSTPFNYTTGKLSPEKSQWISNDNTDATSNPRSRLELHNPDIPTRGNAILRIDSRHDQYVEFTHTDFDADAAQSTVPFIDIQPVVAAKANTKGANLNSGAGVYHRGARGSGGFIGLKLITYDYSHHVSAEPPSSEFTEEDEAEYLTTEFTPIVN